jgi:hypothetical protein
MDKFEEQVQRLKLVLGLRQDQEVAAALGMTKASFSDRRRRGAFPGERVVGLKASHPGLDVVYVLTGKRLGGVAGQNLERAARASAGQAESVREVFAESVRLHVQSEVDRDPLTQQLLDLLPWCSDSDIQLLISLAARLGSSAPRRLVPKRTDGPSADSKPSESESRPRSAGKPRGPAKSDSKVPLSKAGRSAASGASEEPLLKRSRAR